MARLTRKKATEILFDLNNDNLKYICRMLSLPVSGNKSELIDRIVNGLDRLSDLNSILAEFNLDIEGSKKTDSKEKSSDTKAKTKEEEQTEEIRKLFKTVIREIKKNPPPPSVRDEKQIEYYMLGLLKGKFGHRYEVVPQAIGVSRGKSRQPDILIDDSVAIELKYIRGTQSVYEGVGQASNYAKMYPYVILFLYDPYEKRHECALPRNVQLIAHPK